MFGKGFYMPSFLVLFITTIYQSWITETVIDITYWLFSRPEQIRTSRVPKWEFKKAKL